LPGGTPHQLAGRGRLPYFVNALSTALKGVQTICYACKLLMSLRMIALIHQQKAALVELCRRFNVQRLDLFGSAAKGLEQLFGRRVDLVTERSIRNPYFREVVTATRQAIYDYRSS
jgi:predicted nucleotidyltransferase